jgi:hypothetical protein
METWFVHAYTQQRGGSRSHPLELLAQRVLTVGDDERVVEVEHERHALCRHPLDRRRHAARQHAVAPEAWPLLLHPLAARQLHVLLVLHRHEHDLRLAVAIAQQADGQLRTLADVLRLVERGLEGGARDGGGTWAHAEEGRRAAVEHVQRAQHDVQVATKRGVAAYNVLYGTQSASRA